LRRREPSGHHQRRTRFTNASEFDLSSWAKIVQRHIFRAAIGLTVDSLVPRLRFSAVPSPKGENVSYESTRQQSPSFDAPPSLALPFLTAVAASNGFADVDHRVAECAKPGSPRMHLFFLSFMGLSDFPAGVERPPGPSSLLPTSSPQSCRIRVVPACFTCRCGYKLVGPSGSGKSSLVRAGLLPRLVRIHRRWIVVPPLRPGR
jgi:hypothetical protein